MYTQCPKCETVFKLSAEVLRTAGGQVRCGKCGEVFSALARLAEDSSTFAEGESPLELETRADSILESADPAQEIDVSAASIESAPPDTHGLEFAPPGVEIARLEIFDWPQDDQSQTLEDDRSLEFTLPPGELDRIFVESKKTTPLAEMRQALLAPQISPQPAPQSAPQPDAPPAPPAPPPLPDAPPLLEAMPLLDAMLLLDAPPLPDARLPDAPPPDVPPPPNALPPPPETGLEAPPPRNRISGYEVPDEVRRDMLAGFEQHIQSALAQPRGRAARRDTRDRAFLLWLSAAAAAALLLLGQVVHQNREWFAAQARGPFGAGVRALYAAAGSPLPAPANLSAYQLRQWGVTGDPDANGTLRLRASILNAAAQLEPYPLLRVTLADRFGKSIGTRDFEPSEYMGRPTARLLAPGERVDATLEILDPGKNAEGFEIDVCLHGVRGISCANDSAAQTRP